MLNGHNNEYIVLFGNARFDPDRHQKACRHRFASITEAKAFAAQYLNAYIFKLHWPKEADTPDIFRV